MRSRTVREGSVGLLLLLGAGVVIGLVAWLRGVTVGRQSYALDVELADALGLDAGSPVLYRGVKVGRVRSLSPSVNGVTATFDVRPASLVIPKDSVIEVTQSGFVGRVGLSIRPPKAVSVSNNLSPFKPDCDGSVILCEGDRLNGAVGANFDDLIRSTTQLATVLGEGELLNNTNTTLKDFSTMARNANRTLRDVSIASRGFTSLSSDARQQFRSFGVAANSITLAAGQVGTVGGKFSATADNISTAANEVTSLIQSNKSTLVNTLDTLQDTSQELKVTIENLSPIINELEQGKIVENLETLAANGAQVSENLKNLSTAINNPVTLLGLAQTLDSARVTFQNTQKITTDLEQLTGNAEFRKNLIRLINGLSKLISSTQDLEQQVAVVQSESATGSADAANPPSIQAPTATSTAPPLLEPTSSEQPKISFTPNPDIYANLRW
jgi:phospholipid/cholesterol/gamma-HCH transport system substrate-binding protein